MSLNTWASVTLEGKGRTDKGKDGFPCCFDVLVHVLLFFINSRYYQAKMFVILSNIQIFSI